MRDAAARITSSLGLDTPPVALAFVDEPPSGVAVTTDPAPSSCTFWRRGEDGVFYAPAAEHFNCPVGAMVMGLDLPGEVQTELGGLVKSMCDLGYLDPSEAEKIPAVKDRPKAGVVYGPLAEFPIEPDAVVLWLTPRQAMLANEAAGSSSWASAPATFTGRPACAAVPLALQGDRPALSLGCMGMRTFTEVAEDRLLAVLPGAAVAAFASALEPMVTANASMQSFYEGHKQQVEASSQR